MKLTTFFNLHAVIKHNRPIYESCIMLISIKPGIWWCFKKGVLQCKLFIWSGMFSFGLANFLSLSDRMSDMLKKFSTSLNLIHILLMTRGRHYWFPRSGVKGQGHMLYSVVKPCKHDTAEPFKLGPTVLVHILNSYDDTYWFSRSGVKGQVTY